MAGVVLLTPVDPVTFRRRGLQPAVREYITKDDILHLAVDSSIGALVQFRFRFQKPEGTIAVFEEQLEPTSTTQVTKDLRLGEGFLLSCAAQSPTAGLERGMTWVHISIRSGRAGDLTPTRVLVSNYVWANYAAGWPDDRIRVPGAGPGRLNIQNLNVPAPGTDISVAVDTNIVQRVMSFTGVLTTSATVPPRTISFEVDNGIDRFFFGSAALTQPASTARRYSAAPGVGDGALHGATVSIPLPVGLLMRNGFRFRTLTATMAAGDQWSVPTLGVEEWVRPVAT